MVLVIIWTLETDCPSSNIAQALLRHIMLGKLFKSSVPQFPNLEYEDYSNTYPRWVMRTENNTVEGRGRWDKLGDGD